MAAIPLPPGGHFSRRKVKCAAPHYPRRPDRGGCAATRAACRIHLPDGSRCSLQHSGQVPALRHGARGRHSTASEVPPEFHGRAVTGSRAENRLNCNSNSSIRAPGAAPRSSNWSTKSSFICFLVSADLQHFVHDHPVARRGTEYSASGPRFRSLVSTGCWRIVIPPAAHRNCCPLIWRPQDMTSRSAASTVHPGRPTSAQNKRRM